MPVGNRKQEYRKKRTAKFSSTMKKKLLIVFSAIIALSVGLVARLIYIDQVKGEEYEKQEHELFELLKDSDGKDSVVIYISAEKQMKRLPPSRNVAVTPEIVNRLTKFLGENNVKVVEKNIENIGKRD